jgi:hypothetical protein
MPSTSEKMLSRFDPLLHGFVLLPKHQPPGNVNYYEMGNHPSVDGIHDYHRLNGYLSQDGEFVTVWFGLLEPLLVVDWFHQAGVSPPQYNEDLFRGYIESDEQARHILKALSYRLWEPQILRRYPDGQIACEDL